jgi:hypothetical protein
LAAYRNALANAVRFEGHLVLAELADRWMRRKLGDLTTKGLAALMHEFVFEAGEIDEVAETRPEWSEYQYHYDLRLNLSGRLTYIETRLICGNPDDPDAPWIHVVNVHDA